MTRTLEPNALYLGDHPADIPAYAVLQAARYVRMSPATLRSWFLGTTYRSRTGTRAFEPIIVPSQRTPIRLSFSNLVEAHVLMSLRRAHKVPMKNVREAVEVASAHHEIQRPLLQTLQTAFGEIFIRRYGELLHLRRSEQLVVEDFFHAHLKRVDIDDRGRPLRLYPFIEPFYGTVHGEDDRQIVLDVSLGFGAPTLTGVGVRTRTISDRIDAGESVEELAFDYGVPPNQVHAAVAFELAAG